MIQSVRNKDSLLERMDHNTLRWFGQMKTTDEGRVTKRIYRVGVDGVRRRFRLRKRWRDRVGELV